MPASMSPFPNRATVERWRELALKVHNELDPKRRAEILREMDLILREVVTGRKRTDGPAGGRITAA